MNKKLVAGLIVVALILGGIAVGVSFYSRANKSVTNLPVTNFQVSPGTSFSRESTSEGEMPPDIVTVLITDDGFSPDIVAVKVGGSVTFVNTGNRDHRIASNPHPVHTDLPGFDSGDLRAGEGYTYTFTKVGEWSFHDHLNPALVGRVIVTE